MTMTATQQATQPVEALVEEAREAADVEKVARAIYEKRRELLGFTGPIWDWDRWEGESTHGFYADLARAALKALSSSNL